MYLQWVPVVVMFPLAPIWAIAEFAAPGQKTILVAERFAWAKGQGLDLVVVAKELMHLVLAPAAVAWKPSLLTWESILGHELALLT